MRMIPIPGSSMLAAIGYDTDQEVFAAQFQNGDIYRYNGVPEGAFVATITDQESTGKAFNAHVKGPFGQSAKKVEAEEIINL